MNLITILTQPLFSIGLILVWCLALWYKTKDYSPAVDDVEMYKVKLIDQNSQWKRRLYGAHAVDNVKGDRAISIGMHALMSVLIVIGFNPIAGMLFAVHPTNMQVGVWLNGKRYAVCGIIAMMMWLTPFAILLYPLVFTFQPLGILSLALPFIKGHWWLLLALPLVAFGALQYWNSYFQRRIVLRFKDTEGSEFAKFEWRKVIFMIKSLGVYFRQSLFPLTNVMYYEDYFGVSHTDEGLKTMYKADKGLVVGLLALVVVLTQWEGGLWWWMMFIFQWLNLITITQTFADRYTYIANVGMCMWVSTMSPVVWLMLLGYYIARSWENTRQYEGFIQMMKYNHYHSPKNPQAAQNMAVCWMKDGRFIMDAFCMARDTLLKHPGSCTLNFIMGEALCKLGDFKNGIKYLKKSKTLVYECRKEKMLDAIDKKIKEMELWQEKSLQKK